MNRSRRKELDRIAQRVDNELRTLFGSLTEELEAVTDEETDAHANLPESIQDGERGEAMQEAIDALRDAVGLVEDWTSQIDDLLDHITTATGNQ